MEKDRECVETDWDLSLSQIALALLSLLGNNAFKELRLWVG